MNLIGNAIADTPDLGLAMLGLGIFLVVMVFFVVLGYIYSSLTLMITANKLKVNNSWLAWIPVGDFYLKAKMAKMNPWPTLLYLLFFPALAFAGVMFFTTLYKVPAGEAVRESVLFLISIGVLVISGLVISIYHYIYTWKICVARKRPGFWALIPLVTLAIVPFSFIPVLGSIISNLASLAVSVWTMVMWGILAWGK